MREPLSGRRIHPAPHHLPAASPFSARHQASWCTVPVADALFTAGLLPPASARVVFVWLDVAVRAVFRIVARHFHAIALGRSLQRAAALEARNSQLASLCHELRNPLNGVSNCLTELERVLPAVGEALRTFQEGAAVADAVSTNVVEALVCCQDLAETFQGLLDLGSIEAGSLQSAPRPTTARAIVERAAAHIRRTAEHKGLRVDVAVDPRLESVSLLADASRITQVLTNCALTHLSNRPFPPDTACCPPGA